MTTGILCKELETMLNQITKEMLNPGKLTAMQVCLLQVSVWWLKNFHSTDKHFEL
jgi:hypothetical protein